jgi:hypothetical protein
VSETKQRGSSGRTRMVQDNKHGLGRNRRPGQFRLLTSASTRRASRSPVIMQRSAALARAVLRGNTRAASVRSMSTVAQADPKKTRNMALVAHIGTRFLDYSRARSSLDATQTLAKQRSLSLSFLLLATSRTLALSTLAAQSPTFYPPSASVASPSSRRAYPRHGVTGISTSLTHLVTPTLAWKSRAPVALWTGLSSSLTRSRALKRRPRVCGIS